MNGNPAGRDAIPALFAGVFITGVVALLYTLLSPTQWIRSLSHTAFGVSTIVFMNLAYWAALVVHSRKH